jgi:hypothetical protein
MPSLLATYIMEEWSSAGLPDGLFSNKKKTFWAKIGVPWNGKCRYVFFMTNWNILRPFGTSYGRLV